MPEPTRGLDDAEYQAGLTRMDDAAPAGILLISEAELRNFTGLHALFWQCPTLGHGLGMQPAKRPSHATRDERALKEGMALMLEPSLSYGSGDMMVHVENIVVTDGAPPLLSKRSSPGLPLI